MKKIIYSFTLLFAVLFGCNCIASAQIQLNVTKNDSVIIELGGYKQGTISWQRSTTGQTFTTMSAYKDKKELRYKASGPLFFRTKIDDNTCEPVYSDTLQVNITSLFNVKGGQGYIESAPFVAAEGGLTMRENGVLSNWSNSQRKPVWFLYQTPGTYEVSFNIRGSNGLNYQFEMKTSSPGVKAYEPEVFPFEYAGIGSSELRKFFTITIPAAGYYRYELNAISSNMNGLTIEDLKFTGIQEPGKAEPKTYAESRLFSTSLHMGFSSSANTTKEYDWLYEEILVPEGYDPNVTYWMSLGFFAGYMGIQANSPTERRVLFSTWDALDKDRNPNLPKDVLASLVDKADYTVANSFGAEGTGGQSYVGVGNTDTWKTGKPVRFLMNARRDGERVYHGVDLFDGSGNLAVTDGDKINHTIVSAWYDANDGAGWKYIASWRAKRINSKTKKDRDMFDGFYSFLENFWQTNGQLPRKGYYYNAFGKELGSGKWVNFNKVTFTTDGNKRLDHEQGIDETHPDKFYMLSGGYAVGKNSASQLPLLDVNDVPNVKNLNIAEFTARVDQALEHERHLIELEENLSNYTWLDKTGWEVPSYSSQETSGEPNGNGRANLIIDGNDATYWHSRWNGAAAPFPHWFVIDMKEAKTIKGFRIVPSGGQDRYPKNIVIAGSNSAAPDGVWTEIWSGQAKLSPEVITLGAPVSGYHYLKLTILDGYFSGPNTRLGEIYVF